MEKNSHIKIIVRDLSVDVRIGLHDHEQEGGRSQRIIVNAELFADADGYLDNPDRSTIVDYDHIYNEIMSWAAKSHVLLIETYLKDLLTICFQDERVQAAKVSITKPDIFAEAERVGVEAFMKREDWQAA